MPSIKDLYPDKWLRAEHLGNARPRVTIQIATVEELFNPRSRQAEPRIVVSFYDKARRLPLNKTQAFALAQITATDDYTQWAGHQVILSQATAPNRALTILISPIAD